jgi:hypothetical protein
MRAHVPMSWLEAVSSLRHEGFDAYEMATVLKVPLLGILLTLIELQKLESR